MVRIFPLSVGGNSEKFFCKKEKKNAKTRNNIFPTQSISAAQLAFGVFISYILKKITRKNRKNRGNILIFCKSYVIMNKTIMNIWSFRYMRIMWLRDSTNHRK
jgi:hypothetical protein